MCVVHMGMLVSLRAMEPLAELIAPGQFSRLGSCEWDMPACNVNREDRATFGGAGAGVHKMVRLELNGLLLTGIDARFWKR